MERYETAAIELIQLDEDVITASVTRCEYMVDDHGEWWVIYYSDGSQKEYDDWEKPDVCL